MLSLSHLSDLSSCCQVAELSSTYEYQNFAIMNNVNLLQLIFDDTLAIGNHTYIIRTLEIIKAIDSITSN